MDSTDRPVPRTIDHDRYTLRHPWPVDCKVQGGSSGLVLTRSNGAYGTAFVEAFPAEPKTIIRGEGTSITAAEDAAWEKYTRITAGDHEHEFETRGYRNGAGFCTHCGLFASGVFDLAEIGSVCTVCGVGTYWESIGEALYCREHAPDRAQIKAMRAQLRAAGKDTGLGQLGEMFEALLDEEDDADSA
ncbi:hypothetical protein ACFWGN_20985 [Oerskovia sp. NPDC060338]|uniref:hypothetical protein n=1 Tax=Oerskovia sp. NPDC060338 TaxID=3347100 RepID=UPI00365C9840